MLHGKNISRQHVLIEIAGNLVEEQGLGFDILRFKDDMKNDNGIEAFRKDLQQVQARNISRFPTLILKHATQAIMITGFRPYSVLIDAIKQIAPGIERTQTVADANSYTQYWGNITDWEREEATKN
jgi:predicted DsbA family dithiol-disulfide isomerase